jgi:aspartokinase
MSITQTGPNKKIRINGIKLSNKLVQINLLNGSLPESTRPLFFRLLSQNQINIPFILLTCMGEKILGSCCVESKDINRIKQMIDKEPTLKENIEFISSVGALSIFPHHSNLKLLGLSFYLLGKQPISLYGMASSISSLTFIMDYSQLDEAVSILLEYMDLPPNHAPFRPEIHVIQKKR